MSQVEAVAFLEKSKYYLQRHMRVRSAILANSIRWNDDPGMPLPAPLSEPEAQHAHCRSLRTPLSTCGTRMRVLPPPSW